MIIQLITKDAKVFRISNIPEDNGCNYIAEEHHISIYLTDPKNLYYRYNTDEFTFPHEQSDKTTFLFLSDPQNYFFNYLNDVVIIPYNNILGIIYNDKIGRDLYRFIWSKNNGGQELPSPMGIIRDNRVFGQAVMAETALL
jgi:hypothetical protein